MAKADEDRGWKFNSETAVDDARGLVQIGYMAAHDLDERDQREGFEATFRLLGEQLDIVWAQFEAAYVEMKALERKPEPARDPKLLRLLSIYKMMVTIIADCTADIPPLVSTSAANTVKDIIRTPATSIAGLAVKVFALFQMKQEHGQIFEKPETWSWSRYCDDMEDLSLDDGLMLSLMEDILRMNGAQSVTEG